MRALKPFEIFIQKAKEEFPNEVVNNKELKEFATSINIKVPWSKLTEFVVSKNKWNLNPEPETGLFRKDVPEENNDLTEEEISSLAEHKVDTVLTKDDNRKLEEKPTINKDKEEFSNPVFVVMNKNEGHVWGVTETFGSAYKMVKEVVIHGHPEQSQEDALKTINEIGRVDLWSANTRQLKASISKRELTS